MSYYRPATLQEAIAIAANEDVVPLAGATDVYPAAVGRRAWGDPTHKDVLDLSAVAALRGIYETAEGTRIGALATWSDLVAAPLPPTFDGLKAAARAVGGLQVQNRGTIAGNLVTASPAGDGAPNLMALDAEVEIEGPNGTRRVAVERFIVDYRRVDLVRGEIVAALHVPKAPGAISAFEKLGARAYLVISIAMVAGLARIEGGRIVEVRLAVGACSPVARRLRDLEKDLVSVPAREAGDVVASQHFSGLSPIDDIRASGEYRLAAAEWLTRDVLSRLARGA